jgi:hypothetical protein
MSSRSKPKFRYVAISPLRIKDKTRLGPAIYLHEFLVDHQTDAKGNVNYGKPFCYAWIRSHWKEAPTTRTLKRYMRRLKDSGHVWVVKAGLSSGMRVRVLGSAKWPQQPAQIGLFPAPEAVSISSGKAVEKQSISRIREGTKLSPLWGQKCPRNEVKNLREEKYSGNPARFARSLPVEDSEALRALRGKTKTSV